MKKLPKEVLEEFLKGNHVMRHTPGIWNAIWSDMYIESTFMRYGHGPGGIVGITLQPSALKRWAYSLHICTQLTKDVADLQDESTTQHHVKTHKEEMPARKASDAIDRQRLEEKLAMIIHPLENKESQDIINIATGRIAPIQKLSMLMSQWKLENSKWMNTNQPGQTVSTSLSRKKLSRCLPCRSMQKLDKCRCLIHHSSIQGLCVSNKFMTSTLEMY